MTRGARTNAKMSADAKLPLARGVAPSGARASSDVSGRNPCSHPVREVARSACSSSQFAGGDVAQACSPATSKSRQFRLSRQTELEYNAAIFRALGALLDEHANRGNS